ANGRDSHLGTIAAGLVERQPDTEFQLGLRRFSYLLLEVAVALTVLIMITNLLLRRPVIEAVLFSLAIAVGITPQLLPAVVSTSLATGSRRLAKLKVLVKRLVCIEDLGDVDVLITDKTGTLTEGRVTLIGAVDPVGAASAEVLRAGLLATDVDPALGGTSANPLDAALWESAPAQEISTVGVHRRAQLPFDHTRRAVSVLVDDGGSRLLVTKGAPEQVLQRCAAVPAGAQATLDQLFAQGRRVVAVAVRSAPDLTALTAADETGMALSGFLVFADQPKIAARDSLARLAELGIEVKVATGDNPQVAEKVCAELGLPTKGTFTGTQLEALDDARFEAAARNGTVFARISPEQKARLIRVLRGSGRSIGFLGDGVNDALALHSADVGISVDTATD
ncbi:MAG: HAD-IC family P-type ATPase, partial [Mycobacterium sp.]